MDRQVSHDASESVVRELVRGLGLCRFIFSLFYVYVCINVSFELVVALC